MIRIEASLVQPPPRLGRVPWKGRLAALNADDHETIKKAIFLGSTTNKPSGAAIFSPHCGKKVYGVLSFTLNPLNEARGVFSFEGHFDEGDVSIYDLRFYL